MPDWLNADVLALAAFVVAVVGIPVTLWGTRRWGNRRARVLFTYRSTPLLPKSADQQGILKITYRDFDVPAPHLVTLRLRNTGPRDIPSDGFDSGRPLRIDLSSRMYGVVNSSAASMRGDLASPAIGSDDGFIEFYPALLRRDQEWSVEVVVSGDPTPKLRSHLIDTDVVVAEEGSATATGEFVKDLHVGRLALFGAIAAMGALATPFLSQIVQSHITQTP